MKFISNLKNSKLLGYLIRKRSYLFYSLLIFSFLTILPLQFAHAGITEWFIENTLGVLILWIADALAYILDQLAGVAAFFMLATDVSQVPAITESWKVVRDGVNITFIAVLLVVGIFNIIHYEPDTYALKEYMPNFVIAVIGVNFSKLMCLFILDFVNVLTASIYTFIGGAGNTESGLGMYGENIGFVIKSLVKWGNIGTLSFYKENETIDRQRSELDTNIPNDEGGVFSSWDQTIKVFLIIACLVVLILVFLQLIGVFLVRLIKLWVLIVSSPLFFMGLSTSFLSNLSDSWWESFWKYASIPIKVSAFISIGLMLAQKLAKGEGFLQVQRALTQGDSTIQNIVSYMVVVGIIVGTMYAALDSASDDGPGSKIGEWLQKPLRTGLSAIPKGIAPGIRLMGTMGYAVGNHFESRKLYNPFGLKLGKGLGKTIKVLSSPLRAQNTFTGLKDAISKEFQRTQGLEKTRATNAVLSKTGLTHWDWAKNVEKQGYEEQVEAALKIHSGKTGPELDRALLKATDKAERQAIMKTMSKEQGVSVKTFLTNDTYEDYRRNIGFDKSKYKSDAEAYVAFKKHLNEVFPYQFAESITIDAHKLRDQQIEDGKSITKDLEELNIQDEDTIFQMAKEQVQLGNPYKAVGFLVSQVADANLSPKKVNEYIYDLIGEGIDNDVITAAGRAGQRAMLGDVALLRRFNDEKFKSLLDLTGVNNGKDFAQLMQDMAGGKAMKFKDGSAYEGNGGATTLFEENLTLNSTHQSEFTSMSTQDQNKFLDAIENGKEFRDKLGRVVLDENDSKKYLEKTKEQLKRSNNYDKYELLKKIKTGLQWWRQNNRLKVPVKEQSFADEDSKPYIATNLDKNAVSNSLATNGTSGKYQNDVNIAQATHQGILMDVMMMAGETLAGRQNQILRSDDENLERFKTIYDTITEQRAKVYNNPRTSDTVKGTMKTEDGGIIRHLRKTYTKTRDEYMSEGIVLPDWDTAVSGINVVEDPTLAIEAVHETLLNTIKSVSPEVYTKMTKGSII